jgi:hypothetical protein
MKRKIRPLAAAESEERKESTNTMANEHPSNQGKGAPQGAQQQHQEQKRPAAAPAQIAELTGKVSALLADLYSAEQVRILRAVAITNNLDLMGNAKK